MPLLHELLSTGPVVVRFQKADGSVRTMRATTNKELIEERIPSKAKSEDYVPKPQKENVFRVLDLEKNQFRSFRFDRIIDWSPEFPI
jgi:hypothetical protein